MTMIVFPLVMLLSCSSAHTNAEISSSFSTQVSEIAAEIEIQAAEEEAEAAETETDSVEDEVVETTTEIEESSEDLSEDSEQINMEQETTYDYSVSPSEFMVQGVVYADGFTYTWYSENVLPGGGLDIPGRYTSEVGYVCDGAGYIVVASCDLDYGTVLETPFGMAKVYDICPESGIIDVYVSW